MVLRSCCRISRGAQVVSAFAANSDPLHSTRRAQERVLRYPGGYERRIRYVGSSLGGDTDNDFLYHDPYVSFSEGEDPTRWEAEPLDVASLWNSPAAPANPADSTDQVTSVRNTPGQLFAQFSSPAYKRQQQELWEHVRNSYQVLNGSPWVASRQVHLLTVSQENQDAAGMYTLRTRVSQPDAENELTKVLKRRRADGSALVNVDRMVDGVLIFENEAAAEDFGAMLEADGHAGVGVARCDSHELFRMVGGAGAVVVLCSAARGDIPRPEEFAVALRGQRSLED